MFGFSSKCTDVRNQADTVYVYTHIYIYMYVYQVFDRSHCKKFFQLKEIFNL